MRRVFYDFEFLEDGRTIAPLSVGMVSESGDEYYAVFSDAPWDRVSRHRWLCEHVVPWLPLRFPVVSVSDEEWAVVVDRRNPVVRSSAVIAEEVREFLVGGGGKVDLWGYYPAYDHVALAQLWGPMVDLPRGIPFRTKDVRQEMDRLGVDGAPVQSSAEHHALADARHCRSLWQWVQGVQGVRHG